MRIVRKLLVGLGHFAVTLVGLVFDTSTPWLDKKVREEAEQTGRLVTCES
jgi:hypothetical protein